MDVFFGPGGIFDDDPLYDFRIPYAGEVPPPGYTLYQDTITHVHLGPTRIIYPSTYPFYPY
jgi:hypothetical protein